MSKHRVALIGGIGSVAGMRNALPDGCELVGVCDVREHALERARTDDPSLLVTNDFYEIAKMDCDSVVSFTPNVTHRDIAVSCLEGGKHVFIEKPMGITLQQGGEILDAEKAAGKYVGVDLEFRWSKLGQAVKDIITSGEIGELRQLEVDHHRGGWLNNSPQGQYRTKRETSGVFKMEGIHVLDLLRSWGGDFVKVQSFAAPNTLPHYEFSDNHTVMIWFENGAMGRYSASHNKAAYGLGADMQRGPKGGHMFRMSMAGTKGVIDIDVWAAYINVMHYEADPRGSNSLKPEFQRRIDFSGLTNPMSAGHDMVGYRFDFLTRMRDGLPPYQRAADAYESEKIAFALDSLEDHQGGVIDCKSL